MQLTPDPLQATRSPSGDLLFSRPHRPLTDTLIVVLLAVVAFIVLENMFGARAALMVVIPLFAVGLVVAFRGMASRDDLRFDRRRRIVERNGRRLCGYDEVMEVLIYDLKYRINDPRDSSLLPYRVALVLSGEKLVQLAGINGQDEVNDFTSQVSAELGVNARLSDMPRLQ